MLRILAAATLATFAAVGKSPAHEFWIDAQAYTIAPGDELVAALRVGQDFAGTSQSYIPERFTRFDVVTGDDIRPVEGRLGDRPALRMEDMPEGLAIAVHQTTAFDLTYRDFDTFVRFTEHKDLGVAAELQAARGLDQVDVEEEYIRYTRALVAVGDGAGADRPLGLRFELVALANPYTDDLSGGMPVQLWLDGTVQPDVQIELFERAPDDSVTITLHRTDAQGIVRLPVTPGHVYMVDSVALEPVAPEDGAEWRSLWANLTFAVPG